LEILEVGSSFGGFIHYANKHGHHAVGTEVSEEVAAASKGLIKGQVIYSGSRDYPSLFEPCSFDLVYMEHVLEHLPHPEEIIPQLSTLLRENGVLVISVPNQKSWMARLYGIYWDWTSPPLHLHYFDSHNLQLLARESGLKTKLSWTGEYYFRSIYQFFSLSKVWHRARQIINKLSGSRSQIEYTPKHLYKYPSNLRNVIALLPYYIMFPVIKMFALSGKGNDLTVFFVKETQDTKNSPVK
jgi:SAM-dependent methyltransferase